MIGDASARPLPSCPELAGKRFVPHETGAESWLEGVSSELIEEVQETASGGEAVGGQAGNEMKIQILSDLHLEHGGVVPEHHPTRTLSSSQAISHPTPRGSLTSSRSTGRAPRTSSTCSGTTSSMGLRSRDESPARRGMRGGRDPPPRSGMVRIDGTRFIGATLWTDLLLEGKADEIGAHMAGEPGDLGLQRCDPAPGTRLQHRRERGAAPGRPSLHRARAHGGGTRR